MIPLYKNSLKKKLCEEICILGNSTIKTAEFYGVPLKTLEKWITAYRKNKFCFDLDNTPDDFRIISSSNPSPSYDDLSNTELKKQLMKKDIEIARLKKGYAVKGCGMEKKAFVILSKKNTK